MSQLEASSLSVILIDLISLTLNLSSMNPEGFTAEDAFFSMNQRVEGVGGTE